MEKKGCKEIDLEDSEDDYDRRLKHVSSCMTKTLELINYREFDRNTQRVTDEHQYINKMMVYIKDSRTFPTHDGCIKIGIDKYNATAQVLDGNHRLTCAANLDQEFVPQYVKCKYQFCHFPDANRLPSCPDPDNWPTYLCGCDLGFSTFDPT